MREPDFFLIGAPKCATSALYGMVGAHPDVYVATPKEPDYFAADVLAKARPAGAVTEWDDYLRLFASAGTCAAAGEGSVSYLASNAAAAAIRSRVPHARILMILRDPADRLFAHYTAARAAGVTDAPFVRWLEDVVARERASAPIGPVTPGRYATHLARFRREFPATHIHVVWYDDFVRDAAMVLRAVFAFLGVDAQVSVPVGLRANETRVPRLRLPAPLRRVAAAITPPVTRRRLWAWTHTRPALALTAGERRAAATVYAGEVSALAAMTGRSLDHWLPEPA